VTTPLASIGGIAIGVAACGVVVFVAYQVFGEQALGLPAMLGVFTLIAGVSIAGNVGAVGLLVAVAFVVVFMLAIGLAMSLARRGDEQIDEREGR
jgi:hypothetical protein